MTQLVNNSLINKLPAGPVTLYVALARGTVIPHELWESAHFRIKFFLRGLIMPALTHRILKMVTQHPRYADILFSQPRLPCRIHRPYLSNRLSRREGAAAILYHYESMTAFLGLDNFSQHLRASGIRIAQIAGKTGELYSLTLLSTYKLDREGEATVLLRDAAGLMLAELSFTLCRRSGNRALVIGGLQGPNGEDAQDRVQQATKNFHGLFPKRIVLEALLQLALLMRTEHIYGVATESHVYQSRRYNNRKKHMHADYNALWEMSGGTKISDGYYALPRMIRRKDLAALPSKKRAEYRRRFTLLDDVHRQIADALHASPAC